MKRLYLLLVGATFMLSPIFSYGQDPCTPHLQVSNGYENGLFMEAGGQNLADDFQISTNTTNFSASQMVLNVMSQGGLNSVDVIFYEDNNGAPGAVYDDGMAGLVPTSQDIIGDAFGFDVHEVVLDFPAAVEFPGTGSSVVTYWVQLIAYPTNAASQVAWESRTTGVIGNYYFFDNENTSGWTQGDGDLVYSMSGECTYVEGCLTPSDFIASDVTTSSAVISWTQEGGASEWVVEYGPAGFTQGDGTEGTFGSPEITISNLESMTSYDVYVKAVCDIDDESLWAGPFTFSTTDTYCTTPVSNIEPITHVVFAGIDNTTSANAGDVNANEYYLDQQALVEKGETYPITLEGNSDGPYTNNFTVFIDWNQDGEFNNTDERYEIGTITGSTGTDGQQAIGNIEVPGSAATGTTRMRVHKKYNGYPTGVCASVTFGQTHDYTVAVEAAGGCTPHLQVSNGFENGSFMQAGGQLVANDFNVSENTTMFTADNLTANLMSMGGIASVDLYFFSDDNGAPGADYDAPIMGLVPTSQAIIGEAFGFDVHEVVMDFTAVDFPGTGTEAVTYWVQIVATPTVDETQVAWETTTVGIIGNRMYFDNDNTTEWTEGTADGVFSISGECTFNEGCFDPTDILVSNITSSSADLAWVQDGMVDHWIVEYGDAGFVVGEGTTITTYTPSATIPGLESMMDYDAYIKAVCDDEGNETAWIGPTTFTTQDIYCEISFNGDIEPITNVEFAGIENASSAVVNGSPGQEFFLDMIATVDRGETYPIALEGNTNGPYANSFTVFIDWNQDGVFNNDEERYEIGLIDESDGEDGQQAIGDIEVPGTAHLGKTRMRVIKMYSFGEEYPDDACADVTFGQTEDYSVMVEQGDFAGVDCTPHSQVSNGYENGLFMEAGGQNLADDFQVSSNTTLFEANQMTLNALSQGGIASFDVIFYADDNGQPGEVYGTGFAGLAPTSQNIIGSAFGYDVHKVVLDFPTDVEFLGTGTSEVTYWIQLIATPTAAGTQVAWESTTVGVIGNFYNWSPADTPGWNVGDGDLVFSISGQCTGIEGCFGPTNLTASNITTSSADISWTQDDDAGDWVVEYGLEGFTQGEGTEINTTSPETPIDDLESATFYDVYVKAVCGEGDESAWIGPLTFMTLDFYCSVVVSNSVEPITYVQFAGITNSSSADPSSPGHEFFLDHVAEVTTGESYDIAVEGYTGGNFTTIVTVFIDWDQDGEFNNTDERFEIGEITNSTGQDGQQATATINVPSGISLGTTRMRVMKQYFEAVANACGPISWGQAEDYTVEVGPESVVDFDKYAFAYGPNPTAQTINLSSDVLIESVSFYNVLGQKVMTEKINSTSPSLNIATLQNGAYFMEVTISGERKTFKIIKQ